VIEVEKKFIVSDEQLKVIKRDSQFIATVTNNDQYFDYVDYFLMKSDNWLRKRNGLWELKTPKNQNYKARIADVYDEITEENKICEILKIENLDTLVSSEKLVQVFNSKTIRNKYKQNTLNIDIDDITFLDNNFHYNIVEIETMVSFDSEVIIGVMKIIELANKYGLNLEEPYGKILEYFSKFKPDIYEDLKTSLNIKNKRLKTKIEM
jgi:adenylate cyclase class IV